jgi:two-component system, NarL family, sensor kinase
VRLAQQDGNIVLEVKDEGRGIPPEKQEAVNSSGDVGVGFRGMRERIRQLGGSLQIKSDGGGTTVAATLPHCVPSTESIR